MSEKKQTKNKAKKAPKWDNIQKTAFWGIIVVQIAFFSGAYMGHYITENSHNKKESIKTQAVEEYKATQAELKASEQ